MRRSHSSSYPELMLFECWASVTDGGSSLKRHQINISYMLGGIADAVLLNYFQSQSLKYKFVWRSDRGIGKLLCHVYGFSLFVDDL